MIPNILSVAGSDPSGGAGIQADIKSISANDGYAMAAITALTAQNTQGVSGAQFIAPEFIIQQIDSVFDDIHVNAVKVGMLGSADITTSVSHCLRQKQHLHSTPIVVDPVMVAKGGDRLLAKDAVASLRDDLLPIAQLITPNLPEAADLLECSEATSREQMHAQAHRLLELGPDAVLLKGGHLGGDQSPDVLITEGIEHWLEAPRIRTQNTHGTGCTLSSALACQLAKTQDLVLAVEAAKTFMLAAIAAADDLSVGEGIGPVDHFYSLRT